METYWLTIAPVFSGTVNFLNLFFVLKPPLFFAKNPIYGDGIGQKACDESNFQGGKIVLATKDISGATIRGEQTLIIKIPQNIYSGNFPSEFEELPNNLPYMRTKIFTDKSHTNCSNYPRHPGSPCLLWLPG